MNDAGPQQIWRISTHWTQGPPQPTPQPKPSLVPWQISESWLQTAPIRKEYREERETEMSALLDDYRDAGNSASDFAQSVIKASFLLNGGAIVALPAIVTLFRLDAEKLFTMLLITAGVFILGLITTWLASICGFFAAANKGNFCYSMAVKTARNLDAKYFPHAKEEMDVQAKKAESAAQGYARVWLRYRSAAIALCLVALVSFIAGVSVGGIAILKLPPKAKSAAP